MIHQLQREREGSLCSPVRVSCSLGLAASGGSAQSVQLTLTTERHQLRLVITGDRGKLGGRGQVDIDVSSSVARSQEAHIVVILDKVQS